MKVREIMTTDVLTIGPEAELRDVARLFVEHGISGLPVCGARREILGVVSEGDILFKEQGRANEGQSLLARLDGSAARAADKAAAVKVGEAMTAPAITVPPYCSVAEAARLMSEHGINRLPGSEGRRGGRNRDAHGPCPRIRAVRRGDPSRDQGGRAPRHALARSSRGRSSRRGPRCRPPERSPGDEQRCVLARPTRRSRARCRVGPRRPELDDRRYESQGKAHAATYPDARFQPLAGWRTRSARDGPASGGRHGACAQRSHATSPDAVVVRNPASDDRRCAGRTRGRS